MKILLLLIKRNAKLFFKDRGMFFTSLITPAILLVLYATFLGNVYRDSFTSSLPQGFTLPSDILDGLVGAQLMSSILAVSCVTVAFCANFLMVQDKVNGTVKDLKMSPVKSSALSMGYYTATFISTLIICLAATAICLLYIAAVGWYMSVTDVLLLIFDVFLLVLFGTALSSLINMFLLTQGQLSAVGTIISAGYGFICGAYMPIYSFSGGLKRAVMFLSGTYGTSLIRNHSLSGTLNEMEAQGVPGEIINSIRDALDCNLYFFDNKVSIAAMYAVLGLSIILLVVLFVLMNSFKKNKA